MLKISNLEIDKTIKFLNENYPTDKDVFLHICEGYDTIETPDGIGFGVFVKPETKDETPSIFIAGDIPSEDFQIIETLAHEYCHFIQYCEEKEFSEEEAENFAKEVIDKLCGK